MLEHDPQWVPLLCSADKCAVVLQAALPCSALRGAPCWSSALLLCRYAVILAFDVRIERDAQEMADSLGVRIFSAEIIYHLFDAFTKYRQDYKKQKQEEFK